MPMSARLHSPTAAWPELLAQGLQALALPVELQPPLAHYLEELQRWNSAYNLTAVRDPAEMVVRHLLDSLAILPHVEACMATAEPRLLDVGAGAGLPGIPLAIARPQWALSLLDSNGKKARFLRHVQRSLALPQVQVIEGRIEQLDPAAPYPLIVSRAFASLADFVRLSARALAPGGRWLAMKAHVSDEELAAIPPTVAVETIHPIEVPGLREARKLVVLRTVSHP